MDYAERNALRTELHDRIRIALAAELFDILETPLDADVGPGQAATPDDQKERRILQRWAKRAIGDIERATRECALMFVANATDAKLGNHPNLTDQHIKQDVRKLVGVLSAVELGKPDETLPA